MSKLKLFCGSTPGAVLFLLLLAGAALTAMGMVPRTFVQLGSGYAIQAFQNIGLFLTWLIALLGKITWPIVVLAGTILILRSPRIGTFASNLWNRTNKLKLWDVEIGLTVEGAKQLNASAGETFDAYRTQANRELTRLARRYDIAENLRLFFKTDRPLKLADGSDVTIRLKSLKLRCTLYIEDVLFRDSLWQVINYFPADGRQTAGRVFSSRFGIVGRAWRMGQHLAEGQNSQSEIDMIREWGMTEKEAEVPTRRVPSYMCLVLREKDKAGDWSNGAKIALFYIDSETEDAFGSQDVKEMINDALAKELQKHPLMDKLQAMRNELKDYAVEISTTS